MRLKSKLFYSYLIFLIVYSGFVLLPAPSPVVLQQYGVSTLGLRLIYLTIILILAGIWFIGFYGYAKLHAYSQLISSYKDGKQVAKLTKGIFLLVMWLPVSSVASTILNYFALRHLGLMPAFQIISNYINLLFPFLGFVFIGLGSRGLTDLIRLRPTYRATCLLVVFITYVGLVYYRLAATTPNRAAVYHMSIWLILTTLVAPYIYMWFMGLLAAHEVLLYQRKVKGIVYRKSWKLLAFGLGWLITTSIVFQYVTTMSARLTKLNIYVILVIIYSLLAVLSVGFVLIALGARKLQKIEEV